MSRRFENKKLASEAGKKSSKKNKKHKMTLLKDAIGIDRTEQITKNIERNIDEFCNDADERTRLLATKAFADYYKPRKRESSVKVEGTVNFVVSKTIVKKDKK